MHCHTVSSEMGRSEHLTVCVGFFMAVLAVQMTVFASKQHGKYKGKLKYHHFMLIESLYERGDVNDNHGNLSAKCQFGENGADSLARMLATDENCWYRNRTCRFVSCGCFKNKVTRQLKFGNVSGCIVNTNKFNVDEICDTSVKHTITSEPGNGLLYPNINPKAKSLKLHMCSVNTSLTLDNNRTQFIKSCYLAGKYLILEQCRVKNCFQKNLKKTAKSRCAFATTNSKCHFSKDTHSCDPCANETSIGSTFQHPEYTALFHKTVTHSVRNISAKCKNAHDIQIIRHHQTSPQQYDFLWQRLIKYATHNVSLDNSCGSSCQNCDELNEEFIYVFKANTSMQTCKHHNNNLFVNTSAKVTKTNEREQLRNMLYLSEFLINTSLECAVITDSLMPTVFREDCTICPKITLTGGFRTNDIYHTNFKPVGKLTQEPHPDSNLVCTKQPSNAKTVDKHHQTSRSSLDGKDWRTGEETGAGTCTCKGDEKCDDVCAAVEPLLAGSEVLPRPDDVVLAVSSGLPWLLPMLICCCSLLILVWSLYGAVCVYKLYLEQRPQSPQRTAGSVADSGRPPNYLAPGSPASMKTFVDVIKGDQTAVVGGMFVRTSEFSLLKRARSTTPKPLHEIFQKVLHADRCLGDRVELYATDNIRSMVRYDPGLGMKLWPHFKRNTRRYVGRTVNDRKITEYAEKKLQSRMLTDAAFQSDVVGYVEKHVWPEVRRETYAGGLGRLTTSDSHEVMRAETLTYLTTRFATILWNDGVLEREIVTQVERLRHTVHY